MEQRSSIDLQGFYPAELKITGIVEDDRKITITMKSQKHSHWCPKCGQEMRAYHGTYGRTVQDLPIFQKSVMLEIAAYEYYCTSKTCDTKIFAEEYEGFLKKSGRMTVRLEDIIRTLAMETNCEGASAICKELGIKVSGDTIIRLLRKMCDASTPTVGETIGVDDFAYRKGHSYCTVICDGETRRPLEVLEGRDGVNLKEWLKQNKHVKIVTRDRAGAYAKAISEVLPEAMQIADRFHLHQNLLTAIKEALKSELPKRIPIPEPSNSTCSNDTQTVDDDKKNRSAQHVGSGKAPM